MCVKNAKGGLDGALALSRDGQRPAEVEAMLLLSACEDSENVVKIRNWRMDPIRAAKGRDARFEYYRIYMEYCGYGSLMDVATHPVLEAFLWTLLEGLTKAGLLMERSKIANAIIAQPPTIAPAIGPVFTPFRRKSDIALEWPFKNSLVYWLT